MNRILNYYYLVLLRHYDNLYKKDRLSYKVPFIMSLTLTTNIISFITLINHHILESYLFWISIVAVNILIGSIIDVIYNKKRRDRIREKYKEESYESRRLGVVKVVLYEILSIAFLIFSVSMIA